jgi:hypothetical protein
LNRYLRATPPAVFIFYLDLFAFKRAEMKILFLMLFSISHPFPYTQKLILGKLTNMKTLIHLLPAVLLFILFLLEPALAGAPPLQWQKTFGGSDKDGGYSVQQTTDGGYIIIGDTISYDGVYLIKTDPNGNSEWEKTFGALGGSSVQQTSDGGYIIAGISDLYEAGDPNVYLIKTDPNGNKKWQNSFGGTNDDYGFSVHQTSDGGYIIAGATRSFGAWQSDVYLIKTDSNGNGEWEKTFGGSGGERGYSVQQTTDGGYIIAGWTLSYGAGSVDVYLIKTDPNGDSQWQKTFGGSEQDQGWSVQQTTDGGYIIAGYTDSYGAGNDDVYLIKTDPNGNSGWHKTFGGSGDDTAYSVQQTIDGGYIITGGSYSFGVGSWDVYFIKTDPNGNSKWEKTFGGSELDIGRSVQQTSDGGYIIAGSTWSFGAEMADVYLIKTCSDGTLSADFNCNGTVYYEDLEILLGQWLQPPDILSADIAPELGDGIVNVFDFAILANDWLQTTLP